MTSKLAAAYDAFVNQTVKATDSEFPFELGREAFREALKMEMAAKALLLAVETYKAAINNLDHVGKIVSTPQELVSLILDYDQDEVGHAATEVMRASIEDPQGLTMAKAVTA